MTPTAPHSPVLACTDLSLTAGQALLRARQFAQVLGSPLHLLHVLGGSALDDLRHWLGVDNPAELALIKGAQAEVQTWLQPLQAQGEPVVGGDVALQVVSGHVLNEITKAVARLAPRLVVVGARGDGDLMNMVVGSTAERLLRRTQQPLLVVRQPVKASYQRVLVPVDFSPWSAASVAAVRALLPAAHLVLLHAWNVPFEGKLQLAGVDEATVAHYGQQVRERAERALHQLAQAHGLASGEWTPCLVQGDASHRVLEQATRRSCDLIVLGKHGRHVAEDLLLGSVTKHVLAEAELDVLVVPLVEQPNAPAGSEAP